jgi:hypothetical protein
MRLAIGDYPKRRMVDVARLLAVEVRVPVEAPTGGILISPLCVDSDKSGRSERNSDPRRLSSSSVALFLNDIPMEANYWGNK